jgi:hypothetical protein
MSWPLALVLAQLASVDGGAPDVVEPLVADAGLDLPAPTFTPRLDGFSEFAGRFPSEGAPLTTFSVPRVQVGVDATWLGASASVLLEGAYATAGGALVGVSGDSVVIRLREAWAGYRWRFLEARLGMVPTLLIPELERGFRLRELTADGLEKERLVAAADLGGWLKVELPAQLGWVGAAVTNGEGYTSRELNDGKNVELTALVRPLAPLAALRPLEVVGTAAFGSSGLPAIPTQRLGGGAQWTTSWLGVGASAFYARGFLLDPTREGVLVQAFARATLFEHLLVAGRLQYFNRSLGRDDATFESTLAVGGRVAFVEALVAWVRTLGLGDARAALPGFDAHELRLVARFRWPPPLEAHLENTR